MRSLADVQLFTRRYTALRGLEMAPVWAYMALTFAAEGLGWMREGDVGTRLLLIVPVIAIAKWIHRYLDRTFGVVKPFSAGWGWFALGVIAYYVLQIAAIRAHVRIDFTAPFFGLWAAWFALRDGSFRKHWLLPAFIGFLMPLVVPYPSPASVARSAAASMSWAVLFATFAFASLWDHRLLVRSFGHDE